MPFVGLGEDEVWRESDLKYLEKIVAGFLRIEPFYSYKGTVTLIFAVPSALYFISDLFQSMINVFNNIKPLIIFKSDNG